MNRKLKKIIQNNATALESSKKDLASIYRIMFGQGSEVLCEGHDGFRTYRITYAEMRRRIEAAAGALHQRIGTGSFVALEMENCAEWVVGFWAILRSGNKPYLVNMRYPKSLTAGIITRLDIRYSLCLQETGLDVQGIAVAELEKQGGAAPEDVFADEMAFSSSATSMKEVICFYSGKQIAAQILNFKGIIRKDPRIAKLYKGELKQLAFLPFYHVFGLFAVYFWFTFFGRTLVFLKDYSADTILKTCRRHQVTHIFAVPMLWHTIEQQVNAKVRQEPKKQAKLQKGLKIATSLQNICPAFGAWLAKRLLGEVTNQLFGKSVMFCISGGSYLRPSAMELINGLGYGMHNGYGMSEIGITSVELRHKPKERNQNSIGQPFTAVEYKLDEKGGLWVRGETLCTRKLVNGEEKIFDGWFETGDNMQCRDGHYYILGRQGDMVIGESGENINPDTVEQAFCIDGAKMLCVLGMEDVLTMVVQVGAYASQRAITDLRNQIYAINDTLPSTMAVRQFYITRDELAPPTAVKVSRSQLRKKIADGQVRLTNLSDAVAQTSEAFASALLEDVTAIIARELDLEPEKVGVDSHIFHDLGGSSIQYFSIITALSEKFGVSDYNKDDKFCYTPREICEYLERYL
jgi:long-subunit acyl-CoA synthetase (AMP-forming)/acyl carrier protein